MGYNSRRLNLTSISLLSASLHGSVLAVVRHEKVVDFFERCSGWPDLHIRDGGENWLPGF